MPRVGCRSLPGSLHLRALTSAWQAADGSPSHQLSARGQALAVLTHSVIPKGNK